MNDWIKQQIAEKKRIDDQNKFAQTEYESQDAKIHQLLTEAQDEHHARRKAMQKAMMETNLQLAKEKKDKEAHDR